MTCPETRSPDTTTTATTLVQLSELLKTLSPRLEAFKSSIVDATDDETVINTAEGLWTVVDEAIDLLEPIDLEGLPTAIDPDELPDSIDAEKLSTAIATGDAGGAIDLAELYEAVDLRELWKTVDLPALRKEHKELAVAIEAFRPALLSLTFRLVRFADCLAREGVVKLAFEVLGRSVRVAVGFRDQLAEVDLAIRQQNSHILKLDGGVVPGDRVGKFLQHLINAAEFDVACHMFPYDGDRFMSSPNSSRRIGLLILHRPLGSLRFETETAITSHGLSTAV